VIAHNDLASLIPEILLYDRLVFPIPTDDDDRKRWEKNHWNPDQLDQRILELGDLAHPTPWTRELRDEWQTRWDRLKQLGSDTKGLAMNLTPHVLVVSAVWNDRIPPPIMIAAYQDKDTAVADFALIEARSPAERRREELDRKVSALFERRLEMPIAEEPQQAYEKAIELAHNADYQHARRSLFEWEDRRVEAEWPTQAAIKELEGLVSEHDALIKRTFRQTWKRRFFRAVEIVAPPVIEAADLVPLLGLAAGAGLTLVEARFPSITAAPENPLDSAGAALHMVNSVMYHDRS
jgi:hypothetical protein